MLSKLTPQLDVGVDVGGRWLYEPMTFVATNTAPVPGRLVSRVASLGSMHELSHALRGGVGLPARGEGSVNRHQPPAESICWSGQGRQPPPGGLCWAMQSPFGLPPNRPGSRPDVTGPAENKPPAV